MSLWGTSDTKTLFCTVKPLVCHTTGIGAANICGGNSANGLNRTLINRPWRNSKCWWENTSDCLATSMSSKSSLLWPIDLEKAWGKACNFALYTEGKNDCHYHNTDVVVWINTVARTWHIQHFYFACNDWLWLLVRTKRCVKVCVSSVSTSYVLLWWPTSLLWQKRQGCVPSSHFPRLSQCTYLVTFNLCSCKPKLNLLSLTHSFTHPSPFCECRG